MAKIPILRSVGISAVLLVTLGTPRADGPSRFSPWSEPVNLGSVINTPGNDSGPCISRDGLSLYFNSTGHGGYGALDIFVSHRARVGGPWGPPQNLGPNVNSSANDNAPFLSPDGHRLFFQSTRPGGLGSADLYLARRRTRDDLGWEPATNMGGMLNSPSQDGAPVYVEDESSGAATLYFNSGRPGGPGGSDIYASTLQGDETWDVPHVVEELSTDANDAQPGVSKSGLECYVTSDRPGSWSTAADIWVSTRPSTSTPWSIPVNAGPVLNSPDPSNAQGRPSLSADGTELYFWAVRPGGSGNQDLYVSTRVRLRD